MKFYRLLYQHRPICDDDFDDTSHFYDPSDDPDCSETYSAEPSIFFSKEEMLKYAADLHASWVSSGLEPPDIFLHYLDDDNKEVTERYNPGQEDGHGI